MSDLLNQGGREESILGNCASAQSWSPPSLDAATPTLPPTRDAPDYERMAVSETYQIHKRGNTESQISINTSLTCSAVREHRRFPSQIRNEDVHLDLNSYTERSLNLPIRGPPTFLTAALPSFMTASFARTKAARGRQGPNKIAALDGLRGVACLFVFHAHYAYSFGNCLEEASPEVASTRIMYQPFIFLLWSGIAMVDVFFFISGYVLVSKALKLIRADDVSKAFSTISSAIFRRALRLYLPSMALILMAGLLTRMHFFDIGRTYFYDTSNGVVGPQEAPPPYLSSFFAQMYDALKDCYRMADNTIPWGRFNFPYEAEAAARPSGAVYDKHLWTIPVEFKCSMLIFVTLIGTAQVTAAWRLGLHAALLLNCLCTERFSESLFVAGMFFAEIDMVQQESTTSNVPYQRLQHSKAFFVGMPFGPSAEAGGRRRVKATQHLFQATVFVVGLFLLSVPPQGPQEYPAYRLVMTWVPLYIQQKDRFVRAIGAMMTTWPVATSPIIAPLFTNPISHYLGQVSFSMYLVHGTIIKGFWYALLPAVEGAIGGNQDRSSLSSGQFAAIWLTGYMLVFPAVLWTADCFWRAVDQKSITFARWVEMKLSTPRR